MSEFKNRVQIRALSEQTCARKTSKKIVGVIQRGGYGFCSAEPSLP